MERVSGTIGSRWCVRLPRPGCLPIGTNATGRVSGSAGNPVNHVCIAMSRDDVEALRNA